MPNSPAHPPAVLPDPTALPARMTSPYPERYQLPKDKRAKRALGNALGLTHFGVNLTTLEPGGLSAHRHWHQSQDEFVYVLDGQVVLVTDDGECLLEAGMAAGFKAGVANGHQLVNRSNEPARILEVGDRTREEIVDYPDIDLRAVARDGVWVFTNKQGVPY